MSTTELTADAIRQALIERAEAFATRHKTSLSRIGEEALKDNKFLPEVKNGRNFTIGTYQAVIDWMDAKDREAETRAA